MGPREKTALRLRQFFMAAALLGGAACDGNAVDPGPAPRRCFGTASRLFVRGTWEEQDGGAVLLVLVIERPADVKFLENEIYLVQNGQVLSREVGPPVVLKILPPSAASDASYVTLRLGITCGENRGDIYVSANWAQAPKKGVPVGISVADA